MKPAKHTVQWIAPHLSEGEVKALYELVLRRVIGLDCTHTTNKECRTENRLKEMQRQRTDELFNMEGEEG